MFMNFSYFFSRFPELRLSEDSDILGNLFDKVSDLAKNFQIWGQFSRKERELGVLKKVPREILAASELTTFSRRTFSWFGSITSTDCNCLLTFSSESRGVECHRSCSSSNKSIVSIFGSFLFYVV